MALRKYIILRRFLCLLVTICAAVSAEGQKGINVTTGAFSNGIGGISTLLTGSDALLGNFSALHSSDKTGFILTSGNRYSLAELQTIALGGYHSRENSSFGLLVSSYGFEAYREQTAKLLYARRLSKKFGISGSLGWYQLSLGEYGNSGKLIYDLGFTAQLSKNLSYGVLISNLEKSNIDETSVLVSALQVGLRYDISEKVSGFMEVAKELEESLRISVGLNYEIHPRFDLRAGFDAASGNTGGGFTYRISQRMQIDGAMQYQGLLGISPSITLKYQNSQTGN